MLATLPMGWRHAPAPELVSFGIPEADRALGGLPRGRITEITGPASSGRTTLADSIFAAASARGERIALVDACDSFDPASAAGFGVDLRKLIWIRCGGNAEHAIRAADLILHGGGFGVIALDLAGLPEAALARIPPTTWFRFRRAVEPTPSALVVIAGRPRTKTCAALLIEMRRERSGYRCIPRKPAGREPATIHVRLHPFLA